MDTNRVQPCRSAACPLFAALDPDPAGSVDGVLDQENLPLEQEPAPVRADLDRVRPTR
ncbi:MULTISPECIES: hypothetical protein [unclassified Rathayibacter]|uniref:hypothetical protein n=1 Tax=unclassified Rathayibacter TaxID=2609250 RepID=UPI001C615178|nr:MULTISPECIES: hypothetical protein [unclassified Rathayibacter]